MDSPQDAPGTSFEPCPESRVHTVAAESCACKRPSCGRSVPPQTFRRGEKRVYCSDSCRRKDWEAKHPRLDFAPAGWTPAQRDLSAHLQKRETRKARMLARLEQGEATTWELMTLGGAGFSSRLKELRRDGHPISCENRLDYAVYRLEDPE